MTESATSTASASTESGLVDWDYSNGRNSAVEERLSEWHPSHNPRVNVWVNPYFYWCGNCGSCVEKALRLPCKAYAR